MMRMKAAGSCRWAACTGRDYWFFRPGLSPVSGPSTVPEARAPAGPDSAPRSGGALLWRALRRVASLALPVGEKLRGKDRLSLIRLSWMRRHQPEAWLIMQTSQPGSRLALPPDQPPRTSNPATLEEGRPGVFPLWGGGWTTSGSLSRPSCSGGRYLSAPTPERALTPASATVWSCSPEPPLTPMAPMTLPSRLRGMPPAKIMILPSLLAWIP